MDLNFLQFFQMSCGCCNKRTGNHQCEDCNSFCCKKCYAIECDSCNLTSKEKTFGCGACVDECRDCGCDVCGNCLMMCATDGCDDAYCKDCLVLWSNCTRCLIDLDVDEIIDYYCDNCSPHVEPDFYVCEDCKLLQEYNYRVPFHQPDEDDPWMTTNDARELILLKACFVTLKIYNQAQKLTPGNIGYKRARDTFAQRSPSRHSEP